MLLTFTRDIALTNQFWRLKKLIGEEHAWVLWIHLWINLALQAEFVHGAVGHFAGSEEKAFREGLPIPIDDPITVLLKAGFLEVESGGWSCKMFLNGNEKMDWDYIEADTDERVELWRQGLQRVCSETPEAIRSLPVECLTDKDGNPIPTDRLTRAVMLIKTLDGVLKFARRKPEQFSVRLVQAAAAVVERFPDDLQREVILKRFFFKRSIKGFPRQTERLLHDWDQAMMLVYPDEGWQRWAHKGAKPG